MKNKLLSILLCVAMIVGIVPLGLITAVAEETNDVSVSSTDMAFSGTNSVGNMLAAELEEAATSQTQGTGNVVYSVEIEQDTAYIELSTAVSCTLFVGVYTEDKLTLLSSGSVEVTPEEEYAEITLSESVPDYFYIKAFLIDTEDYSPLSAVYDSPMYTEEMQEFLSKTTEDFDEDKVVNFDEDTTNNFAVLADNVLNLEENSDKNVITFADTESDIYIIDNIDESISSLKAGDTFSCVYNGDTVIAKIGEISIDGTTATILGVDAELDEVFDYVKLDAVIGITEDTVDPDSCGEGVTFEGYESDSTTYGVGFGGSVGTDAKFNFNFVKKGSDNANVTVAGNVKLKFVFSPKIYISINYKYLEVKLDYSIGGSVSVTGKVQIEIPIAALTFGIPGVRAELIPQFVFSASGSIEVSGTLLKGTIGYGWYSDVGGVNLTSSPKAEAEIKAEITIFIGLRVEPKIKILEGALAETGVESNLGAELKATLSGNTSDIVSSSKKHDCTACIKGEIYGKFDLKVKGKLLKNETWSLSFKAAEVKVKLFDFYWSITHGEFGFTTCPHISYKLTVTVTDESGKTIENASVTVNGDSYTTDENGQISVFLPNGSYAVNASATDFKNTKKTVVIKDAPKTIALKLEKEIIADVQNSSLGDYHSAAITKSGDLYMWGYNFYGRLGDGTTTTRYTPKKIMSNVISVSLGGEHSAAITKSGDLYMWGYNYYGQLGDGTTTTRYTPQKIMSNVASVSLGGEHSAAITKSGDLYMWGRNDHGQLGDGTTANCYTPKKIMSNVVSVNLERYYSSAITKSSDLYTWGYNAQGRLGDGTTTDCYTPKKIMSNVASVSLGGMHSSAITKSGDLYTWGYNAQGRLGDGTIADCYTPKKIMSNVASVSLGFAHSAAITKSGDLYIWGCNYNGQLGDGTTTDCYTPKKIMSNVASVSLGGIHSSAITKSGDLYMWGKNGNGQLGDGTTTTRYTPTKITLPEGLSSTYSLFSAISLSATEGISSFEELTPNTVYNFYIMKDCMAENAFSNENLLYINQGETDETGAITFEYTESSSDFALAQRFVAEFKNALPDYAIGDTAVKAENNKIIFEVANTNLDNYSNIFARFTIDEENFDTGEYIETESGMQFTCDIAEGLPASTEISVQLFASYNGIQYQSKKNSCLLIDATNTPYGGYCGETVYWSLDSDTGVLNIFGNGDMGDYDASSSYAPWSAQRETIKSVIVKSGVTSIGSNAFYDCGNLTSVTMPNSVSSINEGAFEECPSLKTVTFIGTEEEWNNIYIGSDNDCLTDADIIFAPNGVISGDVSGDGKVDSADLLIMQNIMLGNAEFNERADFDGNGVLDAVDLLLVQLLLLGY